MQGTLGGIINANTANTTIDDTAWANGSVVLSEGWNMLEDGRSNYINQVCTTALTKISMADPVDTVQH